MTCFSGRYTVSLSSPCAAPLVALCVALLAPAARAQTGEPSYARPTSPLADRIRLSQLVGDTTFLDGYLLRSPSLTPSPAASRDTANSGDTTRAPHRSTRWLRPDLYGILNTAVPFSMNDGALWGGVGPSFRASAGAVIARGRLRMVLLPEVDLSTNGDFSVNNGNRFFSPPLPFQRSLSKAGFEDPWYYRPYSADVPRRFGSDLYSMLDPGQSGAWYDSGPLEFGVTSENMWWGPGVRNAIVMSDNAAGIPRLELRTPRALRTRAGAFQWIWFTGGLTESKFFDEDPTNNTRSISAMALTWRPAFQPTLTLGATRAVYAAVSGWKDVPLRWLDVFANTGHPDALPASDSTLHPGGRDQLFSLFGRWLFPADGFEVYAEWARQELPTTVRDFLTAPDHSGGYTWGVQWMYPGDPAATRLRIQGEVTTLEQSATFRDRPVGVFYTSRSVIQGYTQRGQVIGAAIGPGASSQWLAIDRVGPRASYGVTFNRIRWNEDVHSSYPWPAYLGYCNHDVSLLPGIRAGRAISDGYLSGELILGTRLNAFFQNASGCPSGGPVKYDAHNTTLAVTFTPFLR